MWLTQRHRLNLGLGSTVQLLRESVKIHVTTNVYHAHYMSD